MSHFVEAEFPMGVDPGEPEKPKTIEIVNPEKLAEAVEEINAEIKRIQIGQSKRVAYAISCGSFGFPASNVLTMLVTEPTKENLKAFVQISKQDFNDEVGKYFAKLLAPTLEEVPNV
jgi:hypothetical protein